MNLKHGLGREYLSQMEFPVRCARHPIPPNFWLWNWCNEWHSTPVIWRPEAACLDRKLQTGEAKNTYGTGVSCSWNTGNQANCQSEWLLTTLGFKNWKPTGQFTAWKAPLLLRCFGHGSVII
jgi:hypothetical protein